MDYAEVGADDADGEKTSYKLLIGRDRRTKYTFAHLVNKKGTADEKIVGKVLSSIMETGNTSMELKTDGEPALVQVQEAVIGKRQHPTVPVNPPAYDPQSNGAAERAVQEVKAQIRSIKLGIEARVKKEVNNELPILEWMIPHAAGAINRFLIGVDGKTAYQRIHLREFKGKVFEFGEQVLAKPKRKYSKNKRRTLDARFVEATWVGYSTRSNEHIVVLQNGGPAIRVRTVKSRPESERWCHNALNEVIATPDVPNPSDARQNEPKPERETKGIDYGARGGHNLPEQRTQREQGWTRDFRISERLLERFGHTYGCDGCTAKVMGDRPKPHSRECRARIEEAIKSSSDISSEVLRARDDRRSGGVASGAKPSGPEVDSETVIVEEENNEDEATVAPTVNKRQSRDEGPEDDDHEDPSAKRRRLANIRRQRIEASVNSVMNQMIKEGDKAIGALCTRESVKAIIDSLDTACTRKLEREILREEKKALVRGIDVSEVYSQPRMTKMAESLGLKKGFALDLLTNDEAGVPWDLSRPEVQQKALTLLEETKPWLLVVSPPCTVFSPLQRWNFTKMEEHEVEKRLKEGMSHLAFAVLMCVKQAKAGRKYMIEHPAPASSWQTVLLNKLLREADATKVTFDFCQLGMKSEDEHGTGPAQKRTSVMTNSEALAKELSRHRCQRNHRHVPLVDGRARACQEYPDEFCELVCRTVMREFDERACRLSRPDDFNKDSKSKNITSVINQLMLEADPHVLDELYAEFDFCDDITGKALDHTMAVAARKLEMSFFRKMKVYEKVPRWHAKRDGCRVITTRWLDVNKGTEECPNYRARLVGREINTHVRQDLFAATPPLESLRALCSICASNQHGSRPYRMMAVDVKRAYFYAPSRRAIYIEIPVEDYEPGDEDKVAKLNLSLYGTRDAAQNWSQEYSSHLVNNGFVVGRASPCNFKHAVKELVITVHGDDFTAAGPESDLKWFRDIMKSRYDIKETMLGPESHMAQEMRVLNRTISWRAEGITYEPDSKHAELIIEEMGLKGGKPVCSPIVHFEPDIKEQRDESMALDKEDAARYRGVAARLNYLALDRPDLQYAAKCICKYMANPCEYDWRAVKRVARYLVGAPKATQTFHWQWTPEMVTTSTDSDWAGDRADRTSTSGGAMFMGDHLIKSWSSTQKNIALSSAEAELYAMVKAASQTKGFISLMADFGIELKATICSDATAAISIAHRQGLGKLRHVEVQYLWIQGEVAEKKLKIFKIPTKENTADLMTKVLGREVIFKHLEAMSIHRHE